MRNSLTGVVLIAQLAEELDRTTLELALRIVPVEWREARLGWLSGRRKSGMFGIDSVLAGLGHGLDVFRVVASVSSVRTRSSDGGLPTLRDRWPAVWLRCAARRRWRRLGGRAGAGGIPPGQ